MDIQPSAIDGQQIANAGHAARIFHELFWETDEQNPELMEFFPEVSDNGKLLNGLIAGGQRAEAHGLDIEAFLAMERIVRAFPHADYWT